MIIFSGNSFSIDDKDLEILSERVFFKSIDLLGGLKKLAEYRTLTWLPSLARAVFAVVLREEYIKTTDEIASFLGLTKNTVKNILRADEEAAIYKIEHFEDLSEDEKKELKVHVAGGVAKLAYKMVKEGQDSQTVLEFCSNMAKDILAAVECEAPWAYLVLKHTKGIKYPIVDFKELQARLKGIKIKGEDALRVVENISYPIKNPPALLHEIKEYMEGR